MNITDILYAKKLSSGGGGGGSSDFSTAEITFYNSGGNDNYYYVKNVPVIDDDRLFCPTQVEVWGDDPVTIAIVTYKGEYLIQAENITIDNHEMPTWTGGIEPIQIDGAMYWRITGNGTLTAKGVSD